MEKRPKSFLCKVCGVALSSSEIYRRHLNQVHKQAKFEFLCGEASCNLVFARADAARIHSKRRHGKTLEPSKQLKNVVVDAVLVGEKPVAVVENKLIEVPKAVDLSIGVVSSEVVSNNGGAVDMPVLKIDDSSDEEEVKCASVEIYRIGSRKTRVVFNQYDSGYKYERVFDGEF